MYYIIFLTVGLFFIAQSIFTTYTFTKEDSENAAKASAILNNVNHIEKNKNIEKKLGNDLKSVYELNLPISNYLVNDNDNIDDITFLNLLQRKSYEYMKHHPLKYPNCLNLNSDNLLSKDEFNKCLEVEKKEYNWIEDNPKGIKYNVTNKKISEKLNLTNKSDSNKIITDNNYLFKNNSNTIVRSDNINTLLNLLEKEKKEKNYIKVIKIIAKVKNESTNKSVELLENILNDITYFNFTGYRKDEILKNVLKIILDSNGELLIDNSDKYKNIISFIDKNFNDIQDILNKTVFYKNSEYISTNIKTKLLGEAT